MENATPWLVLVANCCLVPILLFAGGFYLGRYGLPVRLVRNHRRAAPGAGRFAADE